MALRLFVSVDLPEPLGERVAAVQDDLAAAGGLNFVDPTQAHLTLKFLGGVDPDRLEAVIDAVSAAVEESGVGAFDAALGGIGAFPSESYIRVVWVGVDDGADELVRLHEAVEARTTAIGFEAESHAFTPHVTIARMEHAGGKDLVQDYLRERDPTVGTMRVEEVRLTESDLSGGRPRYTTVEAFPL